MSAKQHILQAIKNIEAEKEQKLIEMKKRIIPEKIIPYNSEIDASRDKAILEKKKKAEQDIEHIKAVYEQEKLQIEEASSIEKINNEKKVIDAETYMLNKQYDDIILELKQYAEEMED